jgi:hypothetical protein
LDRREKDRLLPFATRGQGRPDGGHERGRLVKLLRRRVGVDIGVSGLGTLTEPVLFSCYLQEFLEWSRGDSNP